ncbi:PREDICTED: probable polyketide synthase 16 [Nanorana parkeri]|uniref:probable polyketide synthase 16 n=1 Tax=Nanorana parkeri TaxID=125878 RepID=UPI000854998E|nr:PREDICTED: probable polyketide synthase 16 [Nanorana parkeri]
MDDPEDQIAIVGIGCNFPGGEGIDNFWKVIIEGQNCTVEIPKERFDTKHWYDSDYNKPGKICTSRAAIVEGIHMFDNKLFGIHNSESDQMDPQHKLLLQCTYRALEDAGYPMESIGGTETGVFIGLMNKDAEFIYNNYPEKINHFNGTGTSMCIAANRISYQFNLTGPSLSLDTACSSSLVALHLACQAIKQGDCELAICGGVSCILDPRIYVALSKAKMISPEGTSKPFSKKADGYGRGEGCGIVVLKPLKQAKEDYSKIWGVICASSINQDGRSVTPITKPSLEQQERLLSRIYTAIDPCSIQYLEAHGTGTPVGDPIEVTSIGNTIGKKHPSKMKSLKIGSVKGNIGHTESAAGMAGLIKVLLMMHHEVIPPSLHYSKELGIKQIEESKLVVPTAPEKWHEDVKFGRMAGINCFGFGGTNSHVVVKQYKEHNSKYDSKRPSEILILSAASSKSLQLSIEDTKKELSKMPSSICLENLVYTAACRRSHLNFKYRAAFLASSLPNLQKQLQSVNTETPPVMKSPQIVFVFCGNGVLSKGMCKVLLENEKVFRAKCLEVDKIIRIYTSLSVVQLLENEYDDFSSPDVAQLLLFTIQVSLVDLLKHWGVNPDCVVGHSVGEVAAAYCSGLLSLEDAVKVIYHRSKLQCSVTGGKMLVVGNVPVTEISDVILSYNGKACIAAYNSPSSCTLSGEGEAIQQISDHLSQHYKKRNIFLHVLDVPAAYHSHLMDPILEDIKDILQNLPANNLKCELISTVSGKPATNGDFTSGDYWAKNIREPVLFEQAIKASTNNKENIVFIEVGPRRALQKNIVDILGPNTTVMPSVHPKNEYETIFSLLINLFKKGFSPNWNNLFCEYKSPPSYIPRYQFEHNKQDICFEKIRQGNQSAASLIHPLMHNVSADFTEFKCTLSKSLTSYVYEHKNLGSALVPGAFYVELALAATVTSLKPRVPLHSLKISTTFLNPCILQRESQELNVKIHQQDQVINFEILTSHVYATGHVTHNNSGTDSDKRIYIPHVVKRCQNVLKTDDVYALLSTFGFEYGKVYKQLCDVHYGEELNEGIAKIKTEEIKETMYEYHMHPVILDCFLQMVGCVVGSRKKEPAAIFPSSIGSLRILQPLQEEMVIYIKLIDIGSSSPQDVAALARVVFHYKPNDHPEPSNSKSNLNNMVSSYFLAQSLPLIELDKNTIAKIPMSVSDAVLFRHNAVYIVAGGLTGLGFETVKFILNNGGGHIVILSRRNPNTEMKQQIAKAMSEKENTKIKTLPCDIGHYAEVKKAIDSIQKIFPNIPIKGVFHSAVVLHDGMLEKLNLSLFEKVLSPKVDGAVNLHCAILNQKLDYFVCFSSVASFIGNYGQANYAAANSFLDIFCQYRRNLGLPAQSINWGALNTGVLLDQPQVRKILQARGLLLLNVPEIHEYLKKCLLLNNTQQAIVKFDFKLIYDGLASRIPGMTRRLFSLVNEYKNNLDGKNQIKRSRVNTQKSGDYILSLVSELTIVTLSDITMGSLLSSLGIDSMLAMTLQQRVFEEKGVNVSVVKLLDPNTTILDVVHWIKENSSDEEKFVENIILDTKL